MADDAHRTIEQLFESHELTARVGRPETQTFEAKGASPYDLDTASGRYELAKDVSAIANAEGGFLVVGLTTEKSAIEALDKVSALDLIAEAAFPADQIGGLLREYVVPRISGVQIGWVADQLTPDRGVGVIQVPRQSDDSKPFLIARVVDGDEEVKQVVFGYCVRIGADVAPYDVIRLQRSMKQGMNSIAQRLEAIEQKLAVLLEAPEPVAIADNADAALEQGTLLDERIRQILRS